MQNQADSRSIGGPLETKEIGRQSRQVAAVGDMGRDNNPTKGSKAKMCLGMCSDFGVGQNLDCGQNGREHDALMSP